MTDEQFKTLLDSQQAIADAQRAVRRYLWLILYFSSATFVVVTFGPIIRSLF
jgi:hypothetical protein